MTSKNGNVLDFFAGSGTTAHAVLKLNKEDNGDRKFIIIEQLDEHIKVCKERIQKVLAQQDSDDSFLYCELAKCNETAKEKINNCNNLEELIKLFDVLYDKYFLNYNVKINKFKEKVIKEENFKTLSLEEQKRMFLTMLDLNQMYVCETEMSDEQFNISERDQKYTSEFYGED